VTKKPRGREGALGCRARKNNPLINGSAVNTEVDNKLKELLSGEAKLSRFCYGEIILIILKKI
jgi:hypothetical protein